MPDNLFVHLGEPEKPLEPDREIMQRCREIGTRESLQQPYQHPNQETDTPVTMPLHPALARSLDAGPIGDITFFVGVGWHGGQMASLYTRAADRERLVKAGMGKVIRMETSIPSPSPKVREPGQKGE
jgi:hypothetical protein